MNTFKNILKYIWQKLAFIIISLVLFLSIFSLYFYWIISLGLSYLLYLLSYFLIQWYYLYRKKIKEIESWVIKKPNVISFFFSYLLWRVMVLFSLFWMVAFFFVYNNDIKPAELTWYHLKNEKTNKEIYFQEMVHLGKKDFYEKINKKIENYTNSWFVLFYEWVTAENENEMEKLWKKIWVQPDEELYNFLWSALWKDIVWQDNTSLLLSAKKSVNADVSVWELLDESKQNKDKKIVVYENTNFWNTNNTNTSWNITNINNTLTNTWEIQKKYEREIIEANIQKSVEKELTDNITEDNSISEIKKLNDKVLNDNFWSLTSITTNEEFKKAINEIIVNDNKTIQYMFRWIFNFVVKNDWIQKLALQFQSQDWENFFKEKILDYRNKNLADMILKSKEDKIFVTYGALHFKWFLEELNKESEKSWSWTYIIVSSETLKPF